jgi:hypothetical protein
MKPLFILGVVLTVGGCVTAIAQTKADGSGTAKANVSAAARADLSGTWAFNAAKSSPGTSGNSPDITFPSQLVVEQTPTEVKISSLTVRQKPVTNTYKLDGSKVTLDMPAGITETGEAKVDGSNVIVTSHRSFASPAGDIVVDFKEVWSVNGNVLTIEKTRVSSEETVTVKGVFDKK